MLVWCSMLHSLKFDMQWRVHSRVQAEILADVGISSVYLAKMHTLNSSMEEIPHHNKRNHLLFSGVNVAYCTSQHKWQKAMV